MLWRNNPGSIVVIATCLAAISTRVFSDVAVGAAGTTNVPEPESVAWAAPEAWLIYTIPVVVLGVGLLTVLFIRNALSTMNWSLADALSEESEVTAWDVEGGTKKPMLDSAGNPIYIVEMRASTTRVIALMGMIVILLMYLGFGTFALFSFGKTGVMPESVDQIVTFLLSGMTLFAPYLVNKFAKLFDGLSPRKG